MSSPAWVLGGVLVVGAILVYHREDDLDVAAKAATSAELKEFTSPAQSMLSLDSVGSSAAPPAVRDAVVELRGPNDAAQKALDALTHSSAVANRSAASPPGDVLYEIVRTCVSLGGNQKSSRVPFAFTAASVNKHWRSVALQFGSLWTTVTIDFDHAINLDKHIDNILERSQGYPLDLTIRKALWLFEPSADCLARLLSASRTIRCSFFSPSGLIYDFDDSLLTIFQSALPHAETIICSDYDPDRVLPMGVRLFTPSPKLRRLEMENIPLDAVDWSLLPHLRTFATKRWITEDQLRTISTSCPHLTNISLRDLDTLPSSGSAHTLHYLERLRCNGRYVLQYLGHHTSVPVLQTLEIPCAVHAPRQLSDFIRETPWISIRILELSGIWRSDRLPEFLDPLRYMPNLVELCLIHESGCLTKFFETWQTAACVKVLPKLHSLVLRQCSFPTWATRALAAFLLARIRVNAKIGRLEIVQTGILPIETHVYSKSMTSELQQLVGEVFIDTDTAELEDPEDLL